MIYLPSRSPVLKAGEGTSSLQPHDGQSTNIPAYSRPAEILRRQKVQLNFTSIRSWGPRSRSKARKGNGESLSRLQERLRRGSTVNPSGPTPTARDQSCLARLQLSGYLADMSIHNAMLLESPMQLQDVFQIWAAGAMGRKDLGH